MGTKIQGHILAVWILAAKLPNSDLNFAVDFSVDFFLLLFPRKKARKKSTKHPPQNSPKTLTMFGKIPLGFLHKPFLDKYPQSGFCTSGARIWGRILGNEFWTPEFRGRILGSIFLPLLFQGRRPQKNSPSRNSPPKINIRKFNPEFTPKNVHIAGVHAKGVVLCERTCFCLLTTFKRLL